MEYIIGKFALNLETQPGGEHYKEIIMEMLDYRNKLSHIYKKKQFKNIYNRIIGTLNVFKSVFDVLNTSEI